MNRQFNLFHMTNGSLPNALVSLPSATFIDKNVVEHQRKTSCFSLAITITILTCYFIAWMSFDPPIATLTTRDLAQPYDPISDTFRLIEYVRFRSRNETAWLGTLLFANCIAIIAALGLVYMLRKDAPLSIRFFDDFNRYRLATVNLGTLFAGAVLLCAVLDSQPHGQMMVIALFCLLTSIGTAWLLFSHAIVVRKK